MTLLPCGDRHLERMRLVRTIGILGTRGIPARYGGFETACETIAFGLRKSGFNVVVACEKIEKSALKPDEYRGIHLVYFSLRDSLRPLSEVLYDVRSLIKLTPKVDAVYMLGYGAGIFFWIPRLLRKTLVVNSDGMEWMRPKFGRVSRLLLRISERFALTLANVVVADSRCVARYVLRAYGKPPVFLAYGTAVRNQPPMWDTESIKRWLPSHGASLRPDQYYLVLARMEPDNNIDKIIQGFTLSGTSRKLLLVGPCISREYLGKLRDLANRDPRIILAGPVYDPELKAMLRRHCAAYLHGHMVGGTNPSLLEALGAGNVVIGADVEFNREVIGSRDVPAFFFHPNPESISTAIDRVDSDLISLRERARVEGPARIERAYNWDDIIQGYADLFRTI